MLASERQEAKNLIVVDCSSNGVGKVNSKGSVILWLHEETLLGRCSSHLYSPHVHCSLTMRLSSCQLPGQQQMPDLQAFGTRLAKAIIRHVLALHVLAWTLYSPSDHLTHLSLRVKNAQPTHVVQHHLVVLCKP